MFVFKYLSAYLILAFFSIADSCQPPTPLQFGRSYHEQVHGVQNHASYSPENNVDYDPNYSNRVDAVPQGPVAAGVLPNSPANPIPVPPLTFTPHNQQPPKDPFSLFGGATGSSIGKECKEDEIRNVEEFLGCTEIQPSDADSENSRFGTEKCDFEPGVVCR
uniref:Uncharacterized protein n=1 Tax=Acrobeloides nanus TaxID=290746 RepID=A0A914E8Q6_9BILA